MENSIKAAVTPSNQDISSPTNVNTKGFAERFSMEGIKHRYSQEWVLIADKELNPNKSVVELRIESSIPSSLVATSIPCKTKFTRPCFRPSKA